ncbi:Ubiquinone biosynthesis O-methyltransferase, mitochondrial [Usitatibacter rugosus]|uniref:Ubiquinone biosynthesis O-methyltransferase, mitochondrial n=1 Tax=Usitatibacter rugosus TaxID=2732067 RepID=A0A6M4GUD9_9PROT|nr:class I SAM-dependent methyltransferase [Usitatibacter rugosus]QJR09953.1 Ubiquinone biosynthesis O-methyltransferase, mitochondrial [Usitatibacter rugosus]
MNAPETPQEPDLPFTGERFVPGAKGEIWIEHWHRYHFASRWAAGRVVLDIACGEGYGSALLARTAAHVTGLDISEQAIDHANRVYAGLANTTFKCASCTRIPLADASVDLAISFETVEHITEQKEFLAELARVLKPGGVLLMSCPNKLEYTDKRDYHNEFHVKELYRAELAQLVGTHFPHIAWYGQRPSFFSVISPETVAGSAAQVIEIDETNPAEASDAVSNPLYFIVAASRDAASVAATPGALSVLSDRDDWVHRDYVKVMGMLESSVRNGERLANEVRDRNLSMIAFQKDFAKVNDELTRRLVEMADLNREISQRDRAIEEKDRELSRRRGFRWWLKLPFIRVRDFFRG